MFHQVSLLLVSEMLNVLPEAVCVIRVRGAITSPSFVALLLLVSEMAKCIA